MEFGAETTEHKIWIRPDVSFVWQKSNEHYCTYYWNVYDLFPCLDYEDNMKARFFNRTSITFANFDITDDALNDSINSTQMIQLKI